MTTTEKTVCPRCAHAAGMPRGNGANAYAFCDPCMLYAAQIGHKFYVPIALLFEAFILANGYCDLCDSQVGGRELRADHDHETGELRGLVCKGCNHHLGGVDEILRRGLLGKTLAYTRRSHAEIEQVKPVALEKCAATLITEYLAKARKSDAA